MQLVQISHAACHLTCVAQFGGPRNGGGLKHRGQAASLHQLSNNEWHTCVCVGGLGEEEMEEKRKEILILVCKTWKSKDS